MSLLLSRAADRAEVNSRSPFRTMCSLILILWAALSSFSAAAQDHLVCPGDQIKIYGWGGAVWAAASPNCPGGNVSEYPSMGAWETTVRSTCLAWNGAANLTWGPVRSCADSSLLCGTGPNGFAMELSFDHPMGYRADDPTAAQVLPQCLRGYYVAVPQADPNPKPGNPCDLCQAAKGASAPVGDPADALSGNEYQASTDFVSGDRRFSFERSYNSGSNQTTGVGIRWQTEYDARIETTWNSSDSATYASAVYSSLQQACEEGWLTIAAAAKKVWPDTDGATASFQSDTTLCTLSSGRQLPLAFTGNSADYVALASKEPNFIGGSAAATVALMTARRRDGRLYRFTCQDAVCEGESNSPIRLILLPSGYQLDLGDGTVEKYDNIGNLISIVDRDGYTRKITWKNGHLTSVTDSSGRSIKLSYTNDLVSNVVFPDASSVKYTYSNRFELQSVTRSDGTSLKYGYDGGAAAGLLTSVTDEHGNPFLTIHYDAQNRAAGDSFAGGASATLITYPDDDSAVVIDRFGAQRTYHYTRVNGLRLLSAIDGQWCEECIGSSIVYDANGYPSAVTDFRGVIKKTTFGANGLLSQRIEALGLPEERVIQMSWDVSRRVPLTRTTSNHQGTLLEKRGWTYDAGGKVTASCQIDPVLAPNYVCAATGPAPVGVARTTYTYCTSVNTTTCPRVGLLLTTDGPRTDSTDSVSNSYYMTTDESGCGALGGACHRLGDLKSTTNGAGHVTTYVSYDKAGRVTRMMDANGLLTDYSYTARGWLTSKTLRANASGAASPADVTASIAYDSTGTVHSVTDADGVTTTYTYDAAHRLTDITDGTGARVHYTLDGAGNRTAEKVFSPAGTVVRSVGRTFNALAQLTAITDGLNRTVFSASYPDSYDANGNLVHSQDGLGIQRKQAFDGLNRLVATIQDYQGSNAATKDAQSVTSYDALDRVTGFSDPDGLNTTYDIDAFGNVTGLHSPDTGTTTRTYDVAGNRVTSTDATNVASTSTFDALNRVLTTSYPDTSLNIQYKYDEDDAVTGCTGNYSKGRLTRIIETNGGLAWCYDARGNVVRKQQTVGTTITTTTYTWTPGNRLASVTTPNGTLITYARGVVGNITTVTATAPGGAPTTVVSNVVYTAFGPIASYTLGNGQTVTRSYDAAGNLTDIDSAAFSLHMKRDVLGNITAIGDAPGVATPTETYSYDALYRLTGFQGADGNPIESYSYNKTGDRLSKTGPGVLTGNYSYAPGTHHLVGVGTTRREVDARGNTTANVLATGAYGYGYNQRNRLTVVQKDGATVGSYVLNALGQRVQKTADGVTTRFDYDEGSRLLSESAGSGSRDYIWLDDLPVGLVDRQGATSVVSNVRTDGLGTSRAVTDAAGNVLWRWSYARNAFGELQPVASGGFVLNARFPGQYFDAEADLSYNINRDYEAASGRYMQSDPIALQGGLNTYAYIDSRPTAYSDRLGLCPDGNDWWISRKTKEPTGEINPTKGPSCPLPLPNDTLKPIPSADNPVRGCHAAMIEKIMKCEKKCPGIADRGLCVEGWRVREPGCVADHVEE